MHGRMPPQNVVSSRMTSIARIKAFAAGGDNGSFLLATDGSKVVRSIDGGCKWELSYSVDTLELGDEQVEDQVPHVEDLYIPEDSALAFMIIDGVGKSAGSRLLRSEKGAIEGSWEESPGLPPTGAYRELVAAPDSPSKLYLTVGPAETVGDQDDAGASGSIYATEDGGRGWEMRSTGVPVERLTIDNTQALRVYVARASGSVEFSGDGAKTFQPLPLPPPKDPTPNNNNDAPPPADMWRDVAVFTQRPRLPVLVAAASPTRQEEITRVVLSVDGGGTWQDLSIDGLGTAPALTFGNSPAQLFATAGTETNTAFRGPGLLSFDIATGEWTDIDDLGFVSLLDTKLARTPQPTAPTFRGLYARRFLADRGTDPRDDDLIVRFDPPAPPEGVPNLAGRGDCGKQGPPRPSDVRKPRIDFDPAKPDLALEPGKPQRLPIKAKLPAIPSPIDVYFLIDSSDSMDPAIDGLFCSIRRLVRDLPEKGVDIHFGLGTYNDVLRFTYRRLTDVGPPSAAISEALRLLATLQGVDEPMRSALFQTATGKGLDIQARNPNQAVFAGSTINRKVEPNQQANFRKDVYKLVLVVGDEPYEPDTDGEPSVSEVIGSLKDRDIHTLGLRVVPPLAEQLQVTPSAGGEQAEHSPVRVAQLRAQLEEFARGTDSLAPRGGIDCDGGGTPDIPAGAPLVCDINEAGIKSEIDDTIISILRSLEDFQPVRLVPSPGQKLNVTVEDGDAKNLNVKRLNEIAATAVVSCTEDQAGRTYPLSFDVEVGSRVVGSLEGSAKCGSLPAALVPPPKAPAAKEKAQPAPEQRPAAEPAAAPQQPSVPAAPQVNTPQVAAVGAPPPPPPAPAPVQGAPAQAQAPAAATNPGAAAQENRQVSVKLAVADSGGESTDAGRMPATEHSMTEYQMVSFEHRSAVPLPAIVTLGIGLSGLLVFVGVSAAPRRRRGPIEPARVDLPPRD